MDLVAAALVAADDAADDEADQPADRPDSLADLLCDLLPQAPAWTVRLDEVWAHAENDAALPIQGWKLHVSATTASAVDVVRACVPVLVEAGCRFKIARDIAQVEALTHPSCPRENAGKVMTVYPADDAQAVALGDRLDAATAGLDGPRVLSDRCLRPGSLVHYRYGVFTGVPMISHDGEVSSGLRAPDGTVVSDSRAAGRIAPPWARSPFPPQRPNSAGGTVLLAGRYAVREAIRHANRGGVFRADDLRSGAPVVVKQARAHVGTDRLRADVRDRLRNEAAALTALAHTGAVPGLVEVFDQDGDLFVAEQDLGGTSLRAWVTEGMDDGLVRRPWAETGRVLADVARRVADVHAAGAVVRDLSPNNVIVTDAGRAALIDLEFAIVAGQEPAPTRSGTPAYSAPEQFRGATPAPSADAFSLGALLLFAFTGEDPFLGGADAATTRAWLDRGLRRRLVPPRIADLALALCDLDASRRPTSTEVVAVVETVVESVLETARSTGLPTRAALTSAAAVAAALVHRAPFPEHDLDEAITALIERLVRDVTPRRTAVARRSTFGETTLAANVQHGAAGILGVLVQAHAALPGGPGDRCGDRLQARIDEVAGWLERALAGTRPGPVGLYFGWAGPCWALADAGVALGDGDRLARAVEYALLLPTDWPGPDVTHGIAGLGLALVHLWQLTGDVRLRAAVDRVARQLAASVERDHTGVSWRTPRDVESTFAGARFQGFAHGTAGIGAFLDHAAAATGRDEYAALADAAAAAVRRAALVADGTARWGSGPEQPLPALPHWCNGSSGVGTFLARHGDAADRDLLEQAARACVAAKWHSGIAYCHGLAGNADFLLDLDGADHPARAADLMRVLWDRRRSENDGADRADRADRADGPELTDEIGRTTPDFNVGYGGALSVLLRLRYGGRRLWLPEVAR